MLAPHKIDIQQGNYVDQAMVAKLKPEMTRSQVRFILGTALIADPFHTSRWDYVFLTGKANNVHAQHKISVLFEGDKLKRVEGDLVLAADTIVVSGQSILEKPADEADAFHMLSRLRGHSHKVVTAVALSHLRQVRQKTDVTKVTFRHVSDDFIRAYIATGEPMDKAGAYGIQGYGAALVEKVEGDFFGVMGLPVRLVLDLLAEAGFDYDFRMPS